ncbi:RHS repeat-associated core domain-containing protein [Pseudomonas sp. UFMG81]|uniref:RHS repeat-associated core domain-containing protein n=1 Tax=Pseudomonas sp. UFMG81 TaxID=2745936 RepID=UPI00188E2D27|nr:RHS repeat-associated core domain-containing protein [Pseudomonas sp. UFMG81]
MPTYLLACDRQTSPINGGGFPGRRYTAYGALASPIGPMTGFCGQPRDARMDRYPLGNGHRWYNPVLMRFHEADALSPFAEGGINAYMYCAGDPVNHVDPSGRFILALLGHTTGYLSSVVTATGAFNRVALQVVERKVSEKNGLQPQVVPLKTRVGNVLQFLGAGAFGTIGRSMGLVNGLAGSPTDAPGYVNSIANAASSASIAGGGAMLTQKVFSDWLAKTRYEGISTLAVIAETLYEVTGMALIAEAPSHVYRKPGTTMARFWGPSSTVRDDNLV